MLWGKYSSEVSPYYSSFSVSSLIEGKNALAFRGDTEEYEKGDQRVSSLLNNKNTQNPQDYSRR